MNVESIVADVKGRVQPLVDKGQEVVNLSVDTIKQANGLVTDRVQTLFKTQYSAGKEIFMAAQASLEKAKADGLKAVISSPVAYLPEGRDKLVGVYQESISVVTRTGEDLAQLARKSYGDVSKTLNGASETKVRVKKAKTKAKATVRKTAKKVSEAANQVADSAS